MIRITAAVLVLLSLSGLQACSRDQDPARLNADIAAAQEKGERRIAEAQHEAAQETGEANAEASRERADANEEVAVAEAKALYEVEIKKCQGLGNESDSGDARAACNKKAKARYESTMAKAPGTKPTEASADQRR